MEKNNNLTKGQENKKVATIAVVGYTNVGKSSFIKL